MNWNQNQNQNRRYDSVNINSTLFTMTCALLHDRMTVRAWNRNLSITIAPAVSQTQDGVVEYAADKKDQYSTTITPDKALVIENLYDTILKPAIEQGQPKTISVMIRSGNNNNGYQNPTPMKVLTIGYDGTNEFLRLAWNVTEEGVGSTNSCITHVFARRNGYEDFDILTGQKVEHQVDSDFEKFMQAIRNVKYFGPEVSHGIKLDGAYKTQNQTPPSWSPSGNSSYQNNSMNSPQYGGYGNGSAAGFDSMPQYGTQSSGHGNLSSSAPSQISDMAETLPFR